MAIYSYKGIDKQGKEIAATVTSETLPQAKQKIKSQGIMLINIKEKSSKAGSSSPGSVKLSLGKKVSIGDLSIMTRQLATLVKAKIQIVEALSALMDQVDNDYLRVVLSEVKTKVNEGTSLAESLKSYPNVFNNVYTNMVEAGEASGTLEIVLLRLADFTEAQQDLKTRVQSAMFYPIIMGSVGTLGMIFIFIFIIPKITRLFISRKMELPLQTKICITISNFLTNYWYVLIAIVFFSIIAFKKYISSPKGRSVYDRILIKVPILGKIVTMVNVSRFCSSLATLLNSGVPILTSLTIVKNIVGNVHMQKAIEESRTSVKEGSSLAGQLISSKLFPPLVTHMISLGEKSGELEPMLKIVAENYEKQAEARISGLTSILEPIMMIFLGGAVGFIVFSVIVPIMDLSSIK